MVEDTERDVMPLINKEPQINQSPWSSSLPPPYLNHGDHAVVADGVGADAEVSRGISVDDPVHSIPVRAVRLVPVNHRQVGHHHINLVLRYLSRKLQAVKEGGREGGRERGREKKG